MFQTPILFIVFNRIEESVRVFDQIRRIKPAHLFISADGGRDHVPGEKEKCKELQDVLLSKIDWDCNVQTLFHEKNQGCFKAVSSALSWFFKNVSEGIILEDDCLPDLSFFQCCSEMLERYRDNDDIWSINGFNFGYNNKTYSYELTRFMNMWGWATWRRVHDLIDYDMTHWKKTKNKRSYLYSRLKAGNIDLDGGWIDYWVDTFNETADGSIDTWDYQWLYAQLLNRKLSVFPTVNLVANLGFNSNATHTFDSQNYLGKLTTAAIDFPLKHPPTLRPNIKFEQDYVKRYWCMHRTSRKYYLKYLAKKIKSLF